MVCFAGYRLPAQDVLFNDADTAKQSAFPRYGFLEAHLQAGKLISSGAEGLRYIEREPVYNADIRYGLIGYGRKNGMRCIATRPSVSASVFTVSDRRVISWAVPGARMCFTASRFMQDPAARWLMTSR